MTPPKPKRKSPTKTEKPRTALEQAAEMLQPHRPSSLQIKNFCVGLNGVTTYGMLKQALREIASRNALLAQEDVPASMILQIIRENRDLAEMASGFLEELGGVEALKDPAYVERLELDYHSVRLYRDALLDRAVSGTIGRGTLETICALPLKEAEGVLGALMDKIPDGVFSMASVPELFRAFDKANILR